jgi:hypothetical protein
VIPNVDHVSSDLYELLVLFVLDPHQVITIRTFKRND